jgi:hypothetical protein
MFTNAASKQRAITIGIVILGILLVAFFGMRAVRAYKKFQGRRPPPPGTFETNVELMRGWMTIPYISKLYRVPEEIIFKGLKIPQQGNRDKSLKDLDDEYYPATSVSILELTKAIIRANQSPPKLSSPPPAP